MALINIVPFDLNRKPGRPTKSLRTKGTPKTTATEAVHKTPEQRPVVNQGFEVDRRQQERRHGYKPMEKDLRLDLRRNTDNVDSDPVEKKAPSKKNSIDVKV